MPIRIEKDKNTGGNDRRNIPTNPGGGGGRGGIGGGILGALLPLLLKNPKLLIVVAIIGGLVWYCGGGLEGGGGGLVVDPNQYNVQNDSEFSTGNELDEKVYDEAHVFEPLAQNGKNPMPSSVSLEKFAPQRLSQGKQGSCVGWASSYAARTIIHSRATGYEPNSVQFSPSYLYNNISLPGCQGSYIQRAMEYMQNKGVAPFSKFAYNENECSTKPDYQLQELAADYRINGFERLSMDGNKYKTNLSAIKQNLSQGSPVVIGMMVGGSFMNGMVGKDMWVPTQSDYAQRGFGGHAMCVIGYDENYKGSGRGAFQIMNSWGERWGNKGIFWMDYEDFDYFNKEAYAIHSMGSADAPISNEIKLNLGIFLNDSQQNTAFSQVSDMTFRTNIPKQARFKVEVQNNQPCNVYILGQETDQSTYVLFPYTEKHSPYCGIVGSRVFPKDHSMFPDDTGNLDYFVVIASNQPLNYTELNNQISRASGNSLEEKVKNVIGGELNNYQSNTGNNMINLDFKFEKNMAAAVIEVAK